MPVLETTAPPSARPTAPGPRPPESPRARLLVAGVLAVGFVADQVTKAIAPGGHVINPGGTAYLLPKGARGLWEGPHVGAALDLLAVVPLVVMVVLALRAGSTGARAGWSLLAAGWGSNWSDRIGLSAITQPGSPRGAVDWLRVPGISGIYNLADVLVVAGTITLLVVAIGTWVQLSRPLVVGTALLCVLALWVGVWSGDRRAEQSREAAQALHRPASSVALEQFVLQRRIDRADTVSRDSDQATARAALAARRAGVRRAELLLPPGQQFACINPKADRCVVTEIVGGAVRLVYPLRRPAWAVDVGLPPGSCEVVADIARCERDASGGAR